ncbi:hypothetical protein HDU76_007043, partial [Blyttiomyces sp. JEL0837]
MRCPVCRVNYNGEGTWAKRAYDDVSFLPQPTTVNAQDEPLPVRLPLSQPSRLINSEPLITIEALIPSIDSSLLFTTKKNIPFSKSVLDSDNLKTSKHHSTNGTGNPTFINLVKVWSPASSSISTANIDIITVIDTTSTMSGDKFKTMKTTLDHIIDSLMPNDRMSIVFFNRNANVVCPFLRVEDQSESTGGHVIANGNGGDNNNINVAGSTNNTNRTTSTTSSSSSQNQLGGRGITQSRLRNHVASLVATSISSADLVSGIELGKKVIENRRYRNDVCAMILMSDGKDAFLRDSELWRGVVAGSGSGSGDVGLSHVVGTGTHVGGVGGEGNIETGHDDGVNLGLEGSSSEPSITTSSSSMNETQYPIFTMAFGSTPNKRLLSKRASNS